MAVQKSWVSAACALLLIAGIVMFCRRHESTIVSTPPRTLNSPVRTIERDNRTHQTHTPSTSLVLPARSTQTPRFAKSENGQFQANASIYRANITKSFELCYEPISADRTADSAELRISLQHVSRGARTLFDLASASPNDIAAENGTVAISRAGGLKENYQPRGDGIEQTFDFEHAPEGTGDLSFALNINLTGLTPLGARPGRAGGVLFVDQGGKFRVRYGQIFVRDSENRGLVVEPKLMAESRQIVFTVPDAWLRQAAYPISIDPVVGGDFEISVENPNGVDAPAICAGLNSFLVVWDDRSTGTTTPTLVGSIVTASGIASSPFAISQAGVAPRPYLHQRQEIAFDGTNWLVVWSEDQPGGSQIRGAIISPGTLTTAAGAILGGSDFPIANSTGTVEEEPLVAFNGSDFVVAWQSGILGDTSSAAATESQIYFSRVTSQGVAGVVETLPAQTKPPNQAVLFLSSQKPSGDTLLIYHENGDNPPDVLATRIGIDGTVRDAGGVALFNSNITDHGYGQPIGVTFFNNAWQILSSFSQTTDSAIYLHQFSPLGVVTPPSGIFATVGVTASGASADDQFAAAFAGNVTGVTSNGNATGTWLFLRNEKVNSNTHHILGKRIGFDGTDMDPIPFQLDTSTTGNLRNAVASQLGGIFMTTWLDGRKAPTQPGDAFSIFGAAVDTTIADNLGAPLLPVISASPTSGVAPLTVSFDSAGSSGTFDTLTWNFGDGTTSTFNSLPHTYTQDGTYIAQLKLTRGSYTVIRTVVITVGTGGGTNTGGQNQIGTPLASSQDLVSNLFIKAASISLDFTQVQNDSAEILGTLDASALPASLTGLQGSVSIAGVSHAFTLDAKGQFKSDSSVKPLTALALNQAKGLFDWQVQKESLQAAMDSLGAHNTTQSPATIVNVPVTVQIGTFTATTTFGIKYKATVDRSGIGKYNFPGTGQTVSGSFIVTKFSAEQEGPASAPFHLYTIQGQLVRPDGGKYHPTTNGQFVFEVGTYSLSFPAAQFVNKKGSLQFRSRLGASGLKNFSIDVNTGKFTLQMSRIPANGAGGSGLFLASGNNITSAALNLSFKFDLTDGQTTAGRYILISRKNATSKKWGLQ